MPSTKDLTNFPDPRTLESAWKSCAILDIIFCEEAAYRTFDYQAAWSEKARVGRYDNGGGDHMIVFFTGTSAILKGFAHESPVSPHAREEYEVWPGMYDKVPGALFEFLEDDSVEHEEVTFCVWYASGSWKTGKVVFPGGEDDGSSFLLEAIHVTPDDHAEWARYNYECVIDMPTVRAVYDGEPITADMIALLNPQRNVIQALEEIQAMCPETDTKP